MTALRPVVILGLDGATFDVIRPLAAAGRLPNLSRWMATGFHTTLLSTVPAMSFPAWSSFMTGLGPGRHGIFDFTQKLPGAYRIRFANATHRQGASLFGRVSRAGGSVLALGVPASHPPEPVRGLLVSGFEAPVSTGSGSASASDPGLYRSVAARTGPWQRHELDEAAAGEGWHERAVDVLAARIARKTAFAVEALRALGDAGNGPDLVTVVFSESDTVAHHFWRDHDPGSPRHDPSASAERRGAVARIYVALDAACGEIAAAVGHDAPILVISDHGAGGASRNVLYLNRRLEELGLLKRRGGRAGLATDAIARSARDAALRWLSPALAEALFRRVRGPAASVESRARFGGFDWSRTVAFSEEANTQPGVWINAKDREVAGCVGRGDYEKVRSEVIAALLTWELPGGGSVVARARRREEVYEGPFTCLAPDVVVELALDRGYAPSLLPTPWRRPNLEAVRRLEDFELAGGRGRGMNGTHRPEGVFLASGLEPPPSGAAASLPDVAPTVLRAMGIPWNEPLDGAPLAPKQRDYSPWEEAQVASRLRSLGYLP